jgi:Ran GTPase-activating protein (RanGAP) involved in mRNA processing and transport
VIENHNLIYLQLQDCGFDLRAIQLLANAFRQRRNPKSIKVINMGGANIIDEMVTPIIDICSSCPGLQVLDISYSKIGNQGCNLLANMLEHPGCKLKQLNLQGITIDDEAARILANSLANNNKLKRLWLCNCKSITAKGMGNFFGIFQSTSIDETMNAKQ